MLILQHILINIYTKFTFVYNLLLLMKMKVHGNLDSISFIDAL